MNFMKIFKILGIILAVVVVLYFVAGYFLGNLPIASSLFGTNKPRDLGIEITTDSAYTGLSNLNHPTTLEELQVIVDDPSTFTSVETSITSEQASSLISTADIPVKLVQIQFGDNGQVESSGIINTRDMQEMLAELGAGNDIIDTVMDYISNMEWIIYYVSGEFGIENNRVSLDIDKIEIGRIGVPDTLREKLDNNIGSLEGYISNSLAVQGYNIRELSISQGQVNLDLDRPLASMTPWLDFVQ